LLFFPGQRNLECLEPYNATQYPKKGLDRGTPDNCTITSLCMIFQFWKIVEVIIRTCQTPQGENRGFGARPDARWWPPIGQYPIENHSPAKKA